MLSLVSYSNYNFEVLHLLITSFCLSVLLENCKPFKFLVLGFFYLTKAYWCFDINGSLSIFQKKNKQKTEKHKDKKKKKKGQDEDEEKEKKKKKSKKKEKAPERRPFDRDVDLKVSQMDNAQRQAIIKRSQQLTGRFGHGSSVGKFL